MSHLPPIDPRDLRATVDDAAVERIWSRLSRKLPSQQPQNKPMGPRWMAFAAAVGVFGLGVLVGSNVSVETGSDTAAAPSFDGKATDVFAAGTRQRTFSLPGGGMLALQPESVVEVVEVRDGALKLHLLRGRATLDASSATLDVAFVAGEALVSAPAGSVMSVARREVDVDVTVERGSVEITSPAGRHVMHGGESSRVPIVAVVSDRQDQQVPPRVSETPRRSDDAAKQTSDGSNPETPSEQTPVPVATLVPSWFELAGENKFDDAFRLLEERGGMRQVMVSAQSVRELLSLSDIAMAKSKNDLAILALRRVADEFPSDPQAVLAASMLANLYNATGNKELASKYEAQAIKSKQLGEVLLCNKLRVLPRNNASSRAQAAAVASEYLGRYPDGPCAEDAHSAVEEANGDVQPKREERPAPPVTPAPSAAPSSEKGPEKNDGGSLYDADDSKSEKAPSK